MATLLRIRVLEQGAVADVEAFLRRLLPVLEAELEGGARFLQGRVQKATPVGVTGSLRRTWFVAPGPTKGQVILSNSQEYLLPVERGRKPAPVPIKPLELWVRRKLGLKPPQSLSVAFAISRAKAGPSAFIGPRPKGWKPHQSKFQGPRRTRSDGSTPGQHFAEKAIDAALPALERVLAKKMGLRIEAEWVKG